MEQRITTIDEYIAQCDPAVRPQLERLRQIIREEAPTATEMIGYGMPTFYLKQNLVHFALAKKHIGFYPTPSAITAFEHELTPKAYSKGTIRFPLDQALPEELIRKIVRFRVAEMENR